MKSKSYVQKFSKMDLYYRRFHLAFSACLKTASGDIDDLFKCAADYVEQLYQNWYLKELTAMWFNAGDLHLSGKEINRKIPRQIDFYKNEVALLKEKQVVFVVISDALRYEVATELATELNIKVRGSVEISAQQSIFPSITKFGMAALLPGDNKCIDQSGNITVNGIKCASTEQRKAILQSADEMSAVVQYKDFIKMKKNEKNEFIKGKRVIYIYHNVIDAIAEKSAIQSKVFEACGDAVEELCALVQALANLRGGSEVIIASDHGFNYTYSPLAETQKITKTDFDNIVESGRRYIIAADSKNCEYLAEIHMDINTESSALHGYSPLDAVRIKQCGDGENFVYGGMSLQECVVPIVRFKNMRLDSKKYQANKERYEIAPVELMLLASNHKISNMLFPLYFLQKEPVDMNKRAQVYEAFFVDGCDNRISDVHKIFADKTDKETKNRQFKVNFCLNQRKYDKNELYYLLIIDDKANEIQRVEYKIDITFSAEDFDF